MLSCLKITAQTKLLEIKKFVPENSKVLSLTLGHLNEDNFEDALLILGSKEEDSTSFNDELKRTILILISDSSGNLVVKESNNSLVYCKACGGIFGDPLEGVDILKDKSFVVRHYGGSSWRWTFNITFQFSKAENTWILEKEESSSYFNMNIDSTMKEKLVIPKGVMLFRNYKNEN